MGVNEPGQPVLDLQPQLSARPPGTVGQRPSSPWRDALLALLLAAGAATASLWGSGRIPAPIITGPYWKTHSIWFEADLSRNFLDMSNRHATNPLTTGAHPLFPLLTYPWVSGLRVVLGVEPLVAVRAFMAVLAAFWLSTLFFLLRLIGCRRLDAVLFSLLAATSAAAVFWFVVPETYPLGSWAIVLSMGTVALAAPRRIPSWWYVVLGTLTLGVTVTNWTAGLLATFARLPWRRAVSVAAAGCALVLALAWLQHLAFPAATPFPLSPQKRARYFFMEEAAGPAHIVAAFVCHAAVMPAIGVDDRYRERRTNAPILTVQRARPGSASRWGKVAVWLWVGLLGLGGWAALTLRTLGRFRVVLGVILLSQLLLHLIFGDETFLYSLHWLPCLVVLASLSTFTRVRRVALLLAGVLAILLGINNGQQFQQAVALVQRVDVGAVAHGSGAGP